MQVKLGEREKKMIRLGVMLLRKKLGKRGKPNNIRLELASIKHEPIQRLINNINKVSNNTKSEYQKIVIKEYGELGIWLAINHPAFSNIFISSLYDITNIAKKDNFNIKSNLSKFEILIINKVLTYVKNKLLEKGGLYEYIKTDIDNTQNEACAYLLKILKNRICEVDDKELRDSIEIFITLYIWIMIRDTAYRDAFFWSLNNLGNSEIKRLIKQHPTRLVKPFCEHYGNLWIAGKEESKRKIKMGELKMGELSDLESPCSPKLQREESRKGYRR
jgi:hypothetical protein